MFSYENRDAVVTGAGGGLGRALSRELALRHCHVAIADLRSDRLGHDVEHRHRRVDLLINSASISASAPFEQTSPENFEYCSDYVYVQPGPNALYLEGEFTIDRSPNSSRSAAAKKSEERCRDSSTSSDSGRPALPYRPSVQPERRLLIKRGGSGERSLGRELRFDGTSSSSFLTTESTAGS